jgi:Copper transport outer membrane protein, MctB
MFDLRYHVASLAAVFFALVIGILVGVALASHGLGHAERQRLERDLRIAQQGNDSLKRQLDEYRADAIYVGNTYSTVMSDRLKGERIALLFVGSVDRKVRASIGQALDDAHGNVLRTRAITVPVDARAIQRTLAKSPLLASFAAGPKRFNDIGVELADEFVAGGDTPLWDALEGQLVEERSGSTKRPADAVVLVRTAAPQSDLATARLLNGLYSELAGRPLPVVGAERAGTRPSAMPVFAQFGLSTVSDVDLQIGRVALAVLLSNVNTGTGHYGLRRGEDVLPLVPPASLSATTAAGG